MAKSRDALPPHEHAREPSIPCSFSMPRSLQIEISELARGFNMSKSTFVTGLLEAEVRTLIAALQSDRSIMEGLADEDPRELRRLGSSASIVDMRHGVIQAVLRRYRDGC